MCLQTFSGKIYFLSAKQKSEGQAQASDSNVWTVVCQGSRQHKCSEHFTFVQTNHLVLNMTMEWWLAVA
jgi:hypothetical protein